MLSIAVIGLLIVLLRRQHAAERHLRGLEKAAAIRQQAIDEILGTPHYTIPPPPPRTPSEHKARTKWGMGGLAVPVIAWARDNHVPTMLAVAAVGGVLTITPSLTPYVSESPPQTEEPIMAAPPLEPRPPAPTEPDAELDVDQAEPPPATEGPQAQAPEGPPTTTEPPGDRRQQPTPGPKRSDEPEEEPSEEPNGPPRQCIEVDVPPDVDLPACLDDVAELADSIG